MDRVEAKVSAQGLTSAARTSSASPEGGLYDPPALVRQHWAEGGGQEPFWRTPSPVSDPNNELVTLRAAWQEMAERLGARAVPEMPEVFEMPAAATRRVRARVRHVGPAPFVFVDEWGDDPAEQGK